MHFYERLEAPGVSHPEKFLEESEEVDFDDWYADYGERRDEI